MLDGEGRYKSTKLVTDQTRVLNEDEWSECLRRMQVSSFWTMPTEEPPPASGKNLRYRESNWILEGTRENVHHVVDRWTPSNNKNRDTDKYLDVCLYLLRLSGLDLAHQASKAMEYGHLCAAKGTPEQAASLFAEAASLDPTVQIRDKSK